MRTRGECGNVEVLPIGNAMLNDDDLSYYQAFVARGVALFVGPSHLIRSHDAISLSIRMLCFGTAWFLLAFEW